MPSHAGLLRWGLQRLIAGRPEDPPASVFARVAPAPVTPRAPEAALSATWIGHASVLLQVGGRNVLTDPMFGNRAAPVAFAGPRRWVPPGVALEDLPPVDLVLLSHNHYDHLDAGSVRALAGRDPGATWVVPLRLGDVITRWGVERVKELDWWDTVSLAGLEIALTPAQHFSARTPFDRNRTLWGGFTVRAGGRAVYFAGDSGYHPAFAEIGGRLGPFDLALLPVGAYEPRWFMRPVHMNPEEAVRAFEDLGGPAHGTLLGAVHWGTFKLTDEPMDEPPARTRAAWAAAGLPAARLWIPRHGETRAL